MAGMGRKLQVTELPHAARTSAPGRAGMAHSDRLGPVLVFEDGVVRPMFDIEENAEN
jgi:hypothetical protein